MSEKAVSPLQMKQKAGWFNHLGWNWRTLFFRHELVIFILLVLVGLILSLQTDTLFSGSNLANVSRAFSWIAIAAFGECLVIIIGGIDLSVGAVMALAGLISALSLQAGFSIPVAIITGLLTGMLVGWVNGTVISRLKLPAFIVTLGTMSIARGVIFGLTGGWPVRNLPPEFRFLGQSDLSFGAWYLPIPVLIMLGLAVVVSLLLGYTVLGNYIYTLGNSERALLVSGVNITQLRVLVYTLCGALAAIGGLLLTARLGVAAPTAALSYELDVIAAAIIGGASLFGGRGTIWGVLLGAAIMQMLRNGLVLLGFAAYWQAAAIGGMILIAILLDYWRRRRDWH